MTSGRKCCPRLKRDSSQHHKYLQISFFHVTGYETCRPPVSVARPPEQHGCEAGTQPPRCPPPGSGSARACPRPSSGPSGKLRRHFTGRGSRPSQVRGAWEWYPRQEGRRRVRLWSGAKDGSEPGPPRHPPPRTVTTLCTQNP